MESSKEQDIAIAQSFNTTITVDNTPKEAFDAINNVRGWWSEDIEGGTEKLNDEFTYHYRDTHRSKIKLIEVIPDKKVVWLVVDSSINFVKDKTEWTGTKITFEISKKGDKTELRFTHVGLIPQIACFEDCSNAWSGIINGSLQKLITSGKKQPIPKEA